MPKTEVKDEMVVIHNTTSRPIIFKRRVNGAEDTFVKRIRCIPGLGYAEILPSSEVDALRKECKHFRDREKSAEIVIMGNVTVAEEAISERKLEDEREQQDRPKNIIEEAKRKRERVSAEKASKRRQREEAGKRDDERAKAKKSVSDDNEL